MITDHRPVDSARVEGAREHGDRTSIIDRTGIGVDEKRGAGGIAKSARTRGQPVVYSARCAHGNRRAAAVQVVLPIHASTDKEFDDLHDLEASRIRTF